MELSLGAFSSLVVSAHGIPAGPARALSVASLAVAYESQAAGYYRKNGRPSGHLHMVRRGMQVLRDHAGPVEAAAFGPRALRGLRQGLIEQGLSRRYINDLVQTIRRAFRWAVSEELLPVATYQALATVDGLKRGRSAARETAPIGPVPDEVVDRTLPLLSAVVADMVRFQRLVGCRPGEVCSLRPADVDRSGAVWLYRPAEHKTEHHGRARVVYIGPKAQAVLRPYFDREPRAACFSPAESEAARAAGLRARRASKVQPSQVDRRVASPRRSPRSAYTKDSYGKAIRRAAARAGVPHWHPNQLRHAAATDVRRAFGLEGAQVILGHASADVTQVYAERDAVLAERIAREVG